MYGMSPEMLSKMYGEGSLQSRGGGFVFSIKNKIDSGSVSGIPKLSVDGVERSLEGATVQIGKSPPCVRDILVFLSLCALWGHGDYIRA